MTFKVGDRVRVAANDRTFHHGEVGECGKIVEIAGSNGNPSVVLDSGMSQWIPPKDLELEQYELTTTTNESGAVKHDDKKIRTDLLPVTPLIGVAEVLTFGAKKYSPRNWEKGFEWNRPYGAALRHLFDFWNGSDSDPETKLHPLDHALCELMFLREFVKTHPELDNRPSKVVAK